MQTGGRWLMVALLVVGLSATAARAAYTPAQLCQAAKIKAVNNYTKCRLKAEEKFVKKPDAGVRETALAKCDTKLYEAWVFKADDKYGGECPHYDESQAELWFQDALTDATDRLVASLGSASTPLGGPLPFCQLPATGQTTSYQAGDDGEVEAGSKLGFWSYEEVIVDERTGLMWERKDDGGGLHDWDNSYPWRGTCSGPGPETCGTDADCPGAETCQAGDGQTAFPNGKTIFQWVAALNAVNYSGYDDWRIPNVKELQSIVDYGRVDPAVDPVFDQSCTAGCTNCSCTQSDLYWSSSSAQHDPNVAWGVGFFFGAVNGYDKGFDHYVRAVRGGSSRTTTTTTSTTSTTL